MIRIIVFIIILPFTLFSQSWSSLGSGMNGQVFSLCVFNGDLIAGGDFTIAGGINANHIAKWNGSTWSQLGSGIDGAVYSLTVYNNELIAAGYFNMAGGNPASCIAKWNGSAWSALGSGLNSYVTSSAVCNNLLYVGGAFTTAGGTNSVAFASWNGSVWSNPHSFAYIINTIAVQNDTLYAAGESNTVFRMNAGNWEPMQNLPGFFNAAGFYNGHLVVGGRYQYCIREWNGVSWVNYGTGLNLYVTAIMQYGSFLVAGGYFTTANGSPANRIAKWNGSSWSMFGSGMNNAVFALAEYSGGLIAGGLFTTSGGTTTNYIARWSDNVAIEPVNEHIPSDFKLYNNYPNPFNPVTNIRFEISAAENITVAVYDITGREISKVADAYLKAGTYEIQWDASGYSSGVYYCKLTYGSRFDIKKMILLK